MAILNEEFRTGVAGAVTDGKRKITFDTPSDFADWLDRGPDLEQWQWCAP